MEFLLTFDFLLYYVIMSTKKPTQFSSGFTLIELLITVAILAILAGVVLLVLDPAGIFEDTQDATAKTTLKKAAAAVEMCLSLGHGIAGCDTTTEIAALDEVKEIPSGVTLTNRTTYICVSTANPAWYYRTDESSITATSCLP